MQQLLWLILFSLVVFVTTKPVKLSQVDQCIKNIRENIEGKNVTRALGGIVGVGWDDLTNEMTLPIFAMTYDNCLTVPDGDFLIPDNVMAIPKKAVKIEKSSSTHESYESVKHTESQSISGSAGGGAFGVSVSASFSVDMQQSKSHMSKSGQVMSQKKIEYYAFDMIGTASNGFDETFTNRLNEIANAVKDDNLLLAQYKAEEMINDYGSHVVHKAQAGASVTIRSFFTFKETATSEEKSTSASASLKVEGWGFQASVSGSGGSNDAQEKSDKDSKKETFIITKGGPDVDKLLRTNAPDDMLAMDSLVGMKQQGIYIYTLIVPGVMKDFDETTVIFVHDLLHNATLEYYRHNTIPGCTNVTATNYNFRANTEDGTCVKETPKDKKSDFGGVFQTCEYVASISEINQNHVPGTLCKKYELPNPFSAASPPSNGYSCPDSSYNQTKLNEFYIEISDRTDPKNTSNCNFFSRIFGCSDVKNYTITDTVKVTTSLCKKKDSTNGVAMFAGIFENDNIFADEPGCPVGYTEYPFLHTLKICMAEYNENLHHKSIAFGGMTNCRSVKKECTKGFSRYLAATIDNCPYYYCARIIQPNGILTLPKLSRPPYTDKDAALFKTREKFRERMDKLQTEAQTNKKNEPKVTKQKG